jgi:hypothetical protein
MPRSTDRTAQTEPLTPGQRVVAAWEMSPIGEPADLADMIDDEIDDEWRKFERALYEVCGSHNMVTRVAERLGFESKLFPAVKTR